MLNPDSGAPTITYLMSLLDILMSVLVRLNLFIYSRHRCNLFIYSRQVGKINYGIDEHGKNLNKRKNNIQNEFKNLPLSVIIQQSR